MNGGTQQFARVLQSTFRPYVSDEPFASMDEARCQSCGDHVEICSCFYPDWPEAKWHEKQSSMVNDTKVTDNG